jgi:hypothetical protein
LTRWTIAATVAGLLILLGGPWRSNFISPGELSKPHSGDAFKKASADPNQSDPNCATCHKAGDFGPSGLITAAFHASPAPFELKKLAHAKTGEMTALDQSCQKCHPSHLVHQPNVSRSLSCSFCHREHRGAGPMASSTDANCILCHGNGTMLASSQTSASPRALASPTAIARSFAKDHPEFRVHTEKMRDTNTLKFNHALHLQGETIPKLKSGEKLDCRFCHQVDAAGRYFRGVRFENHCQVCHSLQFDPETPGLTLPHGNPDAVSAFLHSLPRQYTDFAARSGVIRQTEQEQFVQQRLEHLRTRVGLGEDFEKRVFFSTASVGPEVEVGAVRGATPALYPGCAYCHEVKSDAGKAQITGPVLVERWLGSAEFDHAKHAGVSCMKCHEAEKSRVTSDVILPSKQACVGCHSQSGGAPNSCASCHIYHAGRRNAAAAKIGLLN